MNTLQRLASLIQESTLDQAPEIEETSPTSLRAANIHAGFIIGRIPSWLLGLKLRVGGNLALFRQCDRLVHQKRVSIRSHAQYQLVPREAGTRPCLDRAYSGPLLIL